MLKGSAAKAGAVNALGLPPLSKTAMLSVVRSVYGIELATADFAVIHQARVGVRKDVKLAGQPTVVLNFLSKKVGKTVSPDQIAVALWGRDPSLRPATWYFSVAKSICLLRQAGALRIMTVYGKGYRVLA